MRPVDAAPADLETVRRILREHAPGLEARAFGSRVSWAARETSDLDLVLMTNEPLGAARMAVLRSAFTDSRLPFRVDVVDWAGVSDSFRKVIESEYVTLIGKGEQRSGEGRTTMTLGRFAPLAYGKGLKSDVRNPSGHVPVFGSNGQVGWHDKALTDGPTVIVGRKGTVGSVHYSPEPCWPIDTTFFISGRDTGLMRFKYYALSTLGLETMNTDSAVPGLNRNAFHAREIRTPPIPEQRAVARVLGVLDDKIEANRRMSATLEGLAQAAFKDWFVDFGPVRAKAAGRAPWLPDPLWSLFPDRLVDSELGQIPEGWEVGRFGDLSCKPQYGYTASASADPVGPKFLRITDINKKNWINWETVPYCDIGHDDIKKYLLVEGDILIARMADPGHGVMIEESRNAVFASYLIRFRPLQRYYGRYLQYWLRSRSYWSLVRARSTGTTRVSLNAKILSDFLLVMPSSEILEPFSRLTDDLRSRVVTNTLEEQSLGAMRDALLPKLISGEVRVRGIQ